MVLGRNECLCVFIFSLFVVESPELLQREVWGAVGGNPERLEHGREEEAEPREGMRWLRILFSQCYYTQVILIYTYVGFRPLGSKFKCQLN